MNVEGQFISVKKVLQVFFTLPGFLDILLKHMQYLFNEIDPQYMCNIVHGKLWRKVKEQFGEKIVIPLIVYFDEYETNMVICSLRSHILIARSSTVRFARKNERA